MYCLSETWPMLRLREPRAGRGAALPAIGRRGRIDPISRGPERHRAGMDGGPRGAAGGSPSRHRASGGSPSRHRASGGSPSRHRASGGSPSRHRASGGSPSRHRASGGSPSRHRASGGSPSRHRASGGSPSRHRAPAAAQKKTAGAWPAVRGSRIAAGGSGVDRVDQLLEVLEGRGRLLQPARRQHQQRELQAEPCTIAQRLDGCFIGRGDGHLNGHHWSPAKSRNK
jgi:hypothetical protein